MVAICFHQYVRQITKCNRDDPPLVIVEWDTIPDVYGYGTKVEAEE